MPARQHAPLQMRPDRQGRPAREPAAHATSTAPVQRYKSVASGQSTHAPDVGPGARAPFTQVSSDISVLPRTGGGPGLGMGYATTTPNQPPLNVANDDTLAINAQAGEPKEFYATTGVINAANAALKDSGSPVSLELAGNMLTPPGGQPLTMVQPTLKGAALPPPGQFINMANTICRDAAKEVMGGLDRAKIGTGGQQRYVPLATSGSQVVGGTHELAHAMTQGPVSADQAETTLRGGHTDAPGQTPGTAYGQASHGGTLDAQNQQLGLNEHAKASVGEGYVTQTIASATGNNVDYSATGSAQTNAFVWGYHYGAVVAQSGDGADQIVMENYNRTGDLLDGQNQLLNQLRVNFAAQLGGLVQDGANPRAQIGQILAYLENHVQPTVAQATQAYEAMRKERVEKTGTMWYFRMVGDQVGQSWHEQQAASHYFANPMSMAVAVTALPSLNDLMFDQGEDTLTPLAQTRLAEFVTTFQQRVGKGATYASLEIEGHASGIRTGITSKGLAERRARNVRDQLVALGLPANKMNLSAATPGSFSPNNPALNRRVRVFTK